jgi:hypothetical protein
MKDLLENFHKAILDNDALPVVSEIKVNPRIDAAAQMAIYIDGYRIRLVAAVKSDYPALLDFIGEAEFDSLAAQYIEENPPSSYNLDKYPIAFSSFLTKYTEDIFASEIAELESAIAEVFIMGESEPIKPEDFSGDAVLKPRTASKLLKFKYNINEWLSQQREGKSPARFEPEESFLYVYRHNNEVQRKRLDTAAYLLLANIFSGIALEAALELTVSQNPQHEEFIAANLHDWFREWMIGGFFSIEK